MRPRDVARPLFVPLAREPFDLFLSGKKTVEVRQDAPRWNANVLFPGRGVVLSKGYGKSARLVGVVGRVARGPSYDRLPEWARLGVGVVRIVNGRFFATDRPLVAFEVVGPLHATFDLTAGAR